MPPHSIEQIPTFSWVFLLAVAGLTAYFARFKGRSPLVWFVIALLLSIFAPLILLFLPRLGPDGQPITDEEPTMTVLTPDPSLANQPSISSPLIYGSEEEDKLWYYIDQAHQQMGPVSIIALREQWHTGLLELNSYVWTEGMTDWKKIDELPELKAILNKTTVI